MSLRRRHCDGPGRLRRNAYGHVFEHSPWIAEAAWDAGLPADADTAAGCIAPCAPPWRRPRRSASWPCFRAHPDLAGKLAQAGRLTAESTNEQASAGLDRLTDEERPTFTASTTLITPSSASRSSLPSRA